MATHATRIFGQPTPENRGPSFAVSIAITTVLFAVAFAAMRSLPDLSLGSRSRVETPVRLQLPQIVAPAVTPKSVPTAEPRTSRARPVAPATVPTTIGAPTSVAPPITAPIATPRGIPAGPRDSTAGAGKATTAADAALQNTLRTGPTGLGIPMSPAWTKSAEKVGNTAAIRDSILRAQVSAIPGMMQTHPPTGKEKAELVASQLAAAMLQRRATTSGNSADLVHLEGKGKDGVGAVSAPGMVSVGLPLFSSGPSKAQRKKNEALDADYQARLRRLGDSVFSKRDRRLADSLRLDSLRRDSLARRPKTPSPDSVAHD
jgi:hypothetical protein